MKYIGHSKWSYTRDTPDSGKDIIADEIGVVDFVKDRVSSLVLFTHFLIYLLDCLLTNTHLIR